MARKAFDPAEALSKLRAKEGGGERRFDIRIDREGRWHHEGRLIEREALVRLFASVLHRDEDGRHWLVTPGEAGLIEVEDAAFVAVELQAAGEGEAASLRFRTNVGEWVKLGADNPLTLKPDPFCRDPADAAMVPYLPVRGRLEARLQRPVFYELAERAAPKEPGGPLGVWSGGVFHELGSAHG